MHIIKIAYLLNVVNKQRLLSKNFGENKILEFNGAIKDEDFILCDSENLEIASSKNSLNIPILLYEEVLLNNIFQSSQSVIQITSLDILEQDLIKYINVGESFNQNDFLEKIICENTLSLGGVFDDIIKRCHLEQLHVFKLIFSFAWLSIFLSQLHKKKVFDLPFEVSFDKRDNDLRINIKCFLKSHLTDFFDDAFVCSGNGYFSQSINRILESVNFLYLSEDLKEGVFELDALVLNSDFSPRVFGHKLPSMYERNKERHNFYSPFLELVNPINKDSRDKVVLKKGSPFEDFNKSSLYERGKLGLEEVAMAIKSQVDFLYPDETLTAGICRKTLSKLGFSNAKITEEEIDALINLVENHGALETFVDLKNAAFDQGGSLLNINEDLVSFIKQMNEVDLVNLNLIKSTNVPETESYLVEGGVSEENFSERVKGSEILEEKENTFVKGDSKEEQSTVEKIKDYSIDFNGESKTVVHGGNDEEVNVNEVVKGGNEPLLEDRGAREISNIKKGEQEIESRIKGLKEDLTEEIIRVSGSGENIDQGQFRVMFIDKVKKHFSVVTKVAEDAGNNIFKSVVSKNIDEGLVSHDPKSFNKKIIDLSSDLKQKDERISDLENELREALELKNKDLHPDLHGLTEQVDNNVSKEIRVKDKVISLLEKKISSLEKNNAQKLFQLSGEELKTNEELKNNLASANERAESFKSLAFEMTNRLKKNNQEINELKGRINKSLSAEKRLSISLKRSDDIRHNLAKEKMLLTKKINSMRQSKNENLSFDPDDLKSLNDKVDTNKAKSNLKLLEAKNRHLETYTLKLKESLSEMNNQYQLAKKDSHKSKLQIKLLEQQIKNLIKRSA